MKTNALKAVKSILLAELDFVTSTLLDTEGMAAGDYYEWLPRLEEVNAAIQFIEQLSNLRVVHMDEDQYQVMRTLLSFHRDNDDFGPFEEDMCQWPYNPNTLNALIERLDNLQAQGL